MRQQYPWKEIYEWCLEQKAPFSAYKLEKRFSMSRNMSKPWLKSSTAFTSIPALGDRTYYTLTPGISYEEFLAAVSKPTKQEIRNLKSIKTAVGTYTLDNADVVFGDNRLNYRYLATHSNSLINLLQSAEKLSEWGEEEYNSTRVYQVIDTLAKSYSAAAMVCKLIEQIFTDSRIADSTTAKYALAGNQVEGFVIPNKPDDTFEGVVID